MLINAGDIGGDYVIYPLLKAAESGYSQLTVYPWIYGFEQTKTNIRHTAFRLSVYFDNFIFQGFHFGFINYFHNFVAQSTFNYLKMEKQFEDIKVIREMMEKSSKFLSLSGLSGVMIGITALFGAAFAYFYLLRDPSLTDYNHMQEMIILLVDAIFVLVISIGGGIYFSYKKAKKNGQKFFNKMAYRILYSLAVPLVAGGLFCLIYLFRGDLRTVISGTLLFYGLALVNASKYTYGEIHYLGLTEILLGLAAALLGRYGILFWTLGFGVSHIVYGLAMYVKYDRKSHE